MIHIVFQTADVDVLTKAIALDETLAGQIFEIKDDFAVGPLTDLDSEEGFDARKQWWLHLWSQSPYAKDSSAERIDDRKTLESILNHLDANPDEEAWIWMAQNQHDVCGYYWLVSQLKDYVGRIHLLYFNNLPFINEKGQIFYPTALHQILPREFLKAKKLNRKITPSEFEVDPDEWKKLVDENATIRILEGGKKIVGVSESFYDKSVLAGLTNDWQKGNRAFHNMFSRMKITTGDIFLLGRVRSLIEGGEVELNGDPAKGWKEFELRLKSNQQPEPVVTSAAEAAQ